jgi:hypothetical protein
MNKAQFTFVQEIGDSLREIFLAPGDFLMLAFSPGLQILGDSRELMLSVAISAMFWLLLLIGARKLVLLGQRIFRRVSLSFRARWFLLKTKLTGRKAPFAKTKRTSKSDSETEVTFNDLDLALLSSAAELDPGFAMSAPDLAKKLKLRPREVQSSLEKLSGNMMLERTLGSTDDYDNFQLTRAGAAFLFMWQRNDD